MWHIDQTGQGLYVPQMESDACGTGFIANLKGIQSHQLVGDALTMLANMHHRGASGCEENTGDGAGILIQIPDAFLRTEMAEAGITLPAPGEYGLGMLFFPQDAAQRENCRTLLNDYIDENDFELIAYRRVPTQNADLGETAKRTEPIIEQVFVKPRTPLHHLALERRLYVLRKFAHHHIYATFPETRDDFYIATLSARTIVYKGQLTARQVRGYYPDLQDPRLGSAIAVIHSRFSTNTVPKWKLAQPFRYIAHNGEINTIQGNVHWWEARESLLHSAHFNDEELERLKPICGKNLSDSAVFDNVLEFMHLAGRSMPHAMMMMIPEAWQHDTDMADHKKAFYEYHAMLMEPWDGPASICFTNGAVVGACLDRNGLRPSRYCLLEDGTLIVASEAGALPSDQSKVIKKGSLQPGKLLIADLDEQRIVADDEVKGVICGRFPYRDWLSQNTWTLADLTLTQQEKPYAEVYWDEKILFQRQLCFGFSREDLQVVIKPMSETADEPIGSMGADTPLAILSNRPQHLSNYFKQLFAQVTNPPIDPIRERLVMSLFSPLGGSKNPLDLDAEHPRCIMLDSPVMSNSDLAKIKNLVHSHFRPGVIDAVFLADGQKGRLQAALDHICAVAEDYARKGYNLLIISDKYVDSQHAPVPSLLATGTIHQHLSKVGLRCNMGIIVEAGDVREVHHFATLLGYGANAVNPYLAYASIAAMHQENRLAGGHDLGVYFENFQHGAEKGILKVMSKMGVSTLQSYIGAQLFEALGIGDDVIKRSFTGTVSRLGGLGYDQIAEETLALHRQAFPQRASAHPGSSFLPPGGIWQWQLEGEAHLFNPKTVHLLQHAVKTGKYEIYREYAAAINHQNVQALTLRGLLAFRKGGLTPISIEEVEPLEEILKRFSTGAMSFGSLSHEAHSTLAIAMNRIGARSNSGEGGEDEQRYASMPGGDSARSAVKQVASGRFGVTSWYLVNADEIQIKMAQGAKPGEGGQLPGHKVDEWIGRVRHATPGVGLISPPPHHDIYSIEDLAQLIYDLKNANPQARISVKLVSKAGVGIIASGVAKAKADVIMISGHDGGTGASPLTSIRHAGLPWELGLAEAHQTLVRNKLRDRVVLQTDGQIRTGRDLAIATLLGAEEWSIATAALVAEGCILMRKCHLNTCPVGIATQDPELRKRFSGKPEHVINFFTFLAQELREIMASLGFRTVAEMVGRVEMLKTARELPNAKSRTLDLSALLHKETSWDFVAPSPTSPINTPLVLPIPRKRNSEALIEEMPDRLLLPVLQNALNRAEPYSGKFQIANTQRAVGTLLSFEISRRWRSEGLPDACIKLCFNGSAGQSFGAFAAKGLELRLEGEANDYFGKGLSGARLIALPDKQAQFDPATNVLVGNVALFGATSGEAYLLGTAGERFAVRNSGAKAVVEGVGDHCCEYMTGGMVIILGRTGRNFAAGMTGGVAFIFDPEKSFAGRYHPGTVDIDPLSAQDESDIQKLLKNHYQFTGSARAHLILDDWEDQRGHFVKVMPRDYKAVLAKMENAMA